MPLMQLHSKRFIQFTESNDELCKVKGAVGYYLKVMNRCKYRLKFGDTVYDHGEKPGNNYSHLEPGINFATGSAYSVLTTN